MTTNKTNTETTTETYTMIATIESTVGSYGFPVGTGLTAAEVAEKRTEIRSSQAAGDTVEILVLAEPVDTH